MVLVKAFHQEGQEGCCSGHHHEEEHHCCGHHHEGEEHHCHHEGGEEHEGGCCGHHHEHGEEGHHCHHDGEEHHCHHEGGEGEHHCCCGHHEEPAPMEDEEKLAMLAYMIHHNGQHLQDLHGLRMQIEGEAGEYIEEAVEALALSNEKLVYAFRALQEQLSR